MKSRRMQAVVKAAAGLAFGLGLAGAPMPAFAEWPTKPVTLIVIAGAGGGSDYTMRLLARELEEQTGQRFNIVNQAQGAGVVGMTTYTSAAPDGYTLGQLSPFAQYRLLGQANFTTASYTPIGQFNVDPAAVHVAQDSPFKSIKEVVDALKENPASLRISCGGTCNASWDIPFASLLLDQGVDVTKVNLIPAQGSAAGLQELASGGVDIVLCSVPETDALAQAGKVRSIGVMSKERLEKYPNIPTVGEQMGKEYVGGTWRGLAGPPKMDPALVATIEAALKKAYESERFQKGMKERGFGPAWLDSRQLTSFMAEHEEVTERVVKAIGYKK